MPRINATGDGIRVHGLAELNRALKAIGRDAQRELKEANVKVAKVEAARIRSAASALGSTAAMVAPGITGGGGNAWAGIKLGTHPAAPGAEFGGQRRNTTMQFQPWRGHEGYFAFPTIRRDDELIERTWAEPIYDLLRRHDLL